MNEEVSILQNRITNRITATKTRVSEVFLYLNDSLGYIDSDPQSSLTKSRIVLEKLLRDLFELVMGKSPSNTMIGKILSNKEFASKIPQRIIFRMNAIREMSNLGPHGGEVESSDAIRVLQNLLDVIEWYIQEYDGLLHMDFAEIIERQIEIMKGFPISYLNSFDYSQLEQILAQALSISRVDESQEDIAFRYSFPQFLDWLRSQSNTI